jgi:calcineurin-like phosphoesterase family protein
MKIFFTGDTHFYHKAIIGYCNRPVVDVEEMNQQLIVKWNERIGPSDEVYHLGDFAFAGVGKAVEILEQLNGHKYLIHGNHDYGIAKKAGIIEHFQWIKDYYVLRVHDKHQNEEDETSFTQYHQPIVLCHFPILSWDHMSHGSWHLHGHCHGSLPTTRMMRMDVGVDTNNMYPYEYQEIKNIMAMRSIVPVDHHGM